MTTFTPHPQTRYTRASLHDRAREIHKPKVQLWNTAWWCVLAAILLSILGIVAIATTEPSMAIRQIAHLFVGMVAAAVVAVPHYRWIQRFSYIIMFVVLGLLVFVLIPFVPEAIVHPRNGARRWINLYFTDFQPSEIAKIGYILALANYLRFRRNYRSFRGLLIPLLLSFVPIVLILLEPDLGTALVFLPTFFAMMVAAGAKLKHILLIIIIGLSLAPMTYPFLKPHQKGRIDAMIAQVRGDARFEDSLGFQGSRAMTLIGAGGIVGVGGEHAADLLRYNALPFEHNDMIFAVVCCRWGLLGGVAVWTLFGLFVIGGILTAGQCKEPFGRLVAVGIVAVLFTQMTINTGMSIGVLPITGITLPFVSYGGSSMVTTWLMIGILLNIGLRRPQYLARKSFEFDGKDGE